MLALRAEATPAARFPFKTIWTLLGMGQETWVTSYRSNPARIQSWRSRVRMDHSCSASGTFGACSLSLKAVFLGAQSQPSLTSTPSKLLLVLRITSSSLWSEGRRAWLASSLLAQAACHILALLPTVLQLLALAVASACNVFPSHSSHHRVPISHNYTLLRENKQPCVLVTFACL